MWLVLFCWKKDIACIANSEDSIELDDCINCSPERESHIVLTSVRLMNLQRICTLVVSLLVRRSVSKC